MENVEDVEEIGELKDARDRPTKKNTMRETKVNGNCSSDCDVLMAVTVTANATVTVNATAIEML